MHFDHEAESGSARPLSCDDAALLMMNALDLSLEPAQRAALDRHLAGCARCAADQAQLQDWQQCAAHWPDETVPDWSRAPLPRQPRNGFLGAGGNQGKWRGAGPGTGLGTAVSTPWWAWTSMAASLTAIALVIGQVRIDIGEHGTRIAFGGSGNAAAITADELDSKLAQFAQLQNASLDNKLLEQELKRTQDNKRMLTAVLSYTREQQKEDFTQLVNYWQSVREQDSDTQRDALRRLYTNQLQNRSDLQQIKASLHNSQQPSESL